MKEYVTISWTRSDGVVRSSITIPCSDMLTASTIVAELGEIAKKIQDIQLEIEEPNIIPGLIGHA